MHQPDYSDFLIVSLDLTQNLLQADFCALR